MALLTQLQVVSVNPPAHCDRNKRSRNHGVSTFLRSSHRAQSIIAPFDKSHYPTSEPDTHYHAFFLLARISDVLRKLLQDNCMRIKVAFPSRHILADIERLQLVLRQVSRKGWSLGLPPIQRVYGID
jgi:hypothetical protein